MLFSLWIKVLLKFGGITSATERHVIRNITFVDKLRTKSIFMDRMPPSSKGG